MNKRGAECCIFSTLLYGSETWLCSTYGKLDALYMCAWPTINIRHFSILEGSLSVIRRSFTSDNNYSQCCIYPAYISINIKTPFITNDHQIICA